MFRVNILGFYGYLTKLKNTDFDNLLPISDRRDKSKKVDKNQGDKNQKGDKNQGGDKNQEWH